MMAIGKWSMYLSAVLFFVIGFGALAVAVVPGADEWFAEEILETGSGFEADEGLIGLVADSDAVQTTSWIFAATFIPTGFLFIYAGRWFKSMEGGFNSMMGSSMRSVQAMTSMYQQPGQSGVVTGTGVVAGTPAATPTPTATPPPPRTAVPDPVVEPPDPTAGGIIS